MGKLFDSMKQRNTALPVSKGKDASPRLQVLPAHDIAPVDDHEPMPFYEVPNENEPKTRSNPYLSIAPAANHPVSPRALSSQRVSLIPAEPASPVVDRHIADEVVVLHRPQSAEALEYRAMAEQLIHELSAIQASSMTILPVHAQTGTVLAANLGSAWAELTKHPLVMIDAARSKPGDDLACYFGLTNAPGWEELMTGSALGEALQQTGRHWFDLIGSGRRLAWSNTQSWARKAEEVIHSLSKHYRHTLLLGPAFPHSPLGLVLAETTACTCILLSTDDAQHPHRELAQQALSQLGKPVVGSILLDS